MLQAQGMESLSVTPGQVVHNGASISAGFVTYRAGSTQYVPTLGYGSCGQSAASSTFNAPAQSDGMGIQSEVDLTGACEGEQPGYVWAATAPESLADTGGGVIDPFNGGRSTTRQPDRCPGHDGFRRRRIHFDRRPVTNAGADDIDQPGVDGVDNL